MWLEELQSAGLRPEDPTLVIWEGVSMYMDRDAVEAVLASVGGSSPLVGPAALAFDFASRTMLEEDTGLVAQMAAIGEPLLFGAEPDEMAAMVEASGLEVLDLLSPFEGLRRYLPVRSTDGESVGLGGTTEFLMVSGNGKMTEPRQLA